MTVTRPHLPGLRPSLEHVPPVALAALAIADADAVEEVQRKFVLALDLVGGEVKLGHRVHGLAAAQCVSDAGREKLPARLEVLPELTHNVVRGAEAELVAVVVLDCRREDEVHIAKATYARQRG